MSRLAVVACVMCALLPLACGGSAGSLTISTGRSPLVGFNDNSVRERTAPATLGASLSARAGAQAVRVTFDWRGAEPSRGGLQLGDYDAIYQALRARGLRPVWTVLFAPAWARDYRCSGSETDCHDPPVPAHDAAWRAILRLIATRYPESTGVEIWNEPNLSGFWGTGPDASRYASLLAQGAAAVHAVAPSMPVISAGLGNVPGAGNVPVAQFLEAVYGAGGMRGVDAVGVHVYPRGLDLSPVRKGLDWARRVERRNGDRHRPLWVTEIGASTAATGAFAAASQAEQAVVLGRSLALLARQRDVHAVFVYSLLDSPSPASSVESGFGVAARSGRPKAGYCVVALLWGRGRACAGSARPAG